RVAIGSDTAVRPLQGVEPRVIGTDSVIADTEDIEAPASVQIDDLSHGEPAVAPGRVGVELAEKGLNPLAHPAVTLPVPRGAVGENVVPEQGKTRERPGRCYEEAGIDRDSVRAWRHQTSS